MKCKAKFVKTYFYYSVNVTNNSDQKQRQDIGADFIQATNNERMSLVTNIKDTDLTF